jgi:hypothetical protein
MTLPRQERTDNFKFALKTLLSAIGDAALDEVFFEPKSFADILGTTWEEMRSLELPTDLSTLLRDEVLRRIEDLEGELEATREDLTKFKSQYTCPYCSAELSSAGGYPIDEHSEGDCFAG